MEPRRRRQEPRSPSEYEFVDASAPEWSGPPVERYDVESPRAEKAAETGPWREAARRRLRSGLSGRRQKPLLESPWRQRRLDEVSFCVIDFETTGGGRDQDDEILEMGAVLVTEGELGREFSCFVDPQRPITSAAQAVHGITAAALEGAPLLDQALPWLLEMTRDRVLVFHNARFDLPFLQRALEETEQEPLRQPVVDTVVLARRVLGPPCGLGILAERLGLPVERLHRALGDARLTARLLIVLLEVFREAGGESLEEVPGIAGALPHRRGRRRPRVDPLAQRLDRAARRGERLCLTYHAGGGVAPLELLVQPLRLRGGVELVAEDCERGCTVVLELGRIGPVRGAS